MPATAERFRLVQRDIGASQQRFAVDRIARKEGEADAGADMMRQPFDLEGDGEFLHE